MSENTCKMYSFAMFIHYCLYWSHGPRVLDYIKYMYDVKPRTIEICKSEKDTYLWKLIYTYKDV